MIALSCGLLTACGRLEFDESPPEPPAGFRCNEPQRFQTAGADIAKLVAVNTKSGQEVALVDTSGNLSLWAFLRDDDTLINTVAGLAIDSDITTTVSATAFDDLVVYSAINGTSSPLGTRMYPRDAAGAPRGAMIEHAELGADRAVATSPTGQLAFANIDVATGDLQLRRIDALGAYRDAPVTVAPGSEASSYASLSPGGPGYLLQYSASVTSPTTLKVALLDDAFQVVAGPVIASSETTRSPIRPKVVWASESDTYLVIWHEKNGVDDDIWYAVLDSRLAPVTGSATLALHSANPEITTDGSDFWVTWKNVTSGALEAASVTSTGAITPRAVATSGGTPKAYSMLQSGNQPVLAWLEGGGSGPDLWFDPFCQ